MLSTAADVVAVCLSYELSCPALLLNHDSNPPLPLLQAGRQQRQHEGVGDAACDSNSMYHSAIAAYTAASQQAGLVTVKLTDNVPGGTAYEACAAGPAVVACCCDHPQAHLVLTLLIYMLLMVACPGHICMLPPALVQWN